MEYHALCLQNLCRICANRAQKRKDIINKKPPKYVINYSDMIYVLFGVDIVNGDSSIQPQKICDECYQYLMNSHKTGAQGEYCHEMNLDGVFGTLKHKVQKTSTLWEVHSDSGCTVCGLYKSQIKAGMPKKHKKGGSIKLLFDISSPNIFHHLFPEDTIVSRKLSDCDMPFLRYKRRSLFVPSVKIY